MMPDKLLKIFRADPVFPAKCLDIIIPFNLLLKCQTFFRGFIHKFCFFGRIVHVILLSENTDLIKKAIYGTVDPLPKLICRQGLDKFVRIFIRTHIDDPYGNACFL